MVGVAREVPTPKVWTPMGQGPDNSKTLFHRGAVMTLTARKAFAVVRDNTQVFVVGATFRRLSEESTNTYLGSVSVYDKFSRKIGKVEDRG